MHVLARQELHQYTYKKIILTYFHSLLGRQIRLLETVIYPFIIE
jgi:DMSO/TMAO reductase YedYZ heme-binding membrane subunit